MNKSTPNQAIKGKNKHNRSTPSQTRQVTQCGKNVKS